jgi:DNA-binding NtrC family response regulator
MWGESKRPILVVEHDAEVLNSLRRLLRAEFELHTAGSAAEALNVLRQQPVQVVLTGQRLPEGTGVELLRQVRQERPDLVGVVCAGYCDLKAVIEALSHGHVYRCVTKPCDAEELRAALHQAGEQYDQAAELRQLLVRLHGYRAQCLEFMQGLREGEFGTLNFRGRAQAEELARAGSVLLPLTWADRQPLNASPCARALAGGSRDLHRKA